MSSSREQRSYGNLSKPPQIMSMPLRGRLFQMLLFFLFTDALLHVWECGCVCMLCVCISEEECVKLGHSCQITVFYFNLSLKQGLHLAQSLATYTYTQFNHWKKKYFMAIAHIKVYWYIFIKIFSSYSMYCRNCCKCFYIVFCMSVCWILDLDLLFKIFFDIFARNGRLKAFSPSLHKHQMQVK